MSSFNVESYLLTVGHLDHPETVSAKPKDEPYIFACSKCKL